MKHRTRFSMFSLALILLLLIPLFASCGAKSDGMMDLPSTEGNGQYGEDAGKEELFGSASGELPSSKLPEGAERKIIKTFDINAETTDFDGALASLKAAVTEHGGYVESATTHDQSLTNANREYSRRASYTVRIPAEQAEAFVSAIGNTLHVTSNNSFVEDISETYYSIEARLQELTVERDSLLEILDAPDTKKDYDLWLTVKQRLSEVTQQIAVYQGQINRYDSQVAYSTVKLSIREVLTYSTIRENNKFGTRLAAAFVDGWNSFVEGAQDFAIWFAESLPVLVLLALLATGVILTVRALRKKRKAKKETQE